MQPKFQRHYSDPDPFFTSALKKKFLKINDTENTSRTMVKQGNSHINFTQKRWNEAVDTKAQLLQASTHEIKINLGEKKVKFM